MKSITLDLIDMLKYEKYTRTHKTDDEIAKRISNVMEDAVSTGGCSLNDYELYKQNPKGILKAVLKEL